MGQGFHLNDFEQSTLAMLAQALSHPGTAELAPMGLGIIQGAQQRRTDNLAARQQGIGSLEQMAAQMAAQGAAPDAVSQMVMGQAEQLPLMGQPRGQKMLGGLGDYVDNLYAPGQQVSGLAPADYRAQFTTPTGGLIDDQDRAAIGQLVQQGLSSGTPFRDIREQVRRLAVGVMPEGGGEAAVAEAERMYSEMIGMPLEQMRGMGDTLRQVQGNDTLSGLFNAAGVAAPQEDLSGGAFDLTSYIGQMMNQDPQTLEQLVNKAPAYLPSNDPGYQPSDKPSFWSAINPGNWFFQG